MVPLRSARSISPNNVHRSLSSWSGLRWRLFGLWGWICSLPKITVTLSLVIITSLGCQSKKIERQNIGLVLDSAYTMLTREVDMLVSDSGLLRYRMRSPLWLIYDNEHKREWLFPEGILISSYDSIDTLGVRLISADTARFLTEKQEWILTGSVKVRNLQGNQLATPKLHWLQDERRIYSDDTTYFYTSGRELRGNRFEASDDLSHYSIYQSSGIMEYQEKDPNAPTANSSADSTISTDSIKPPHPLHRSDSIRGRHTSAQTHTPFK